MKNVNRASEQPDSLPTSIALARATLPRIAGTRTNVALSIFVASLGALWMIHAWQMASALSVDGISPGETRHIAAAAWFICGSMACGTGVLIATFCSSIGRLRTGLTLAACSLVCASMVGVVVSAYLTRSPNSLMVQAASTGLLAATFLGCCGFAALAFRFRAQSQRRP